MKQHDIKITKAIGENTFYIRAFPAFKAANMSGELAALVFPILTSLVPLIAGGKGESADIMDIGSEVACPALASGLSALSGDKVENLLGKLLTKYGNISVEQPGGLGAQLLTEDLANEVFCGEVQDMFILAFEVIKANFSSFFQKAGGLLGSRLDGLLKNLQ